MSEKKSVIVYVAKKLGMSFLIPKLDKDGKPVEKINRHTGLSDPDYIVVRFTPAKTKASEGYLSKYVVNADTPALIRERLAELAADPSADIITEQDYIRETNPDRSKAEEKLSAVTEQLEAEKEKRAEAEKIAADKDNAIEEMRKKIEALEKRNKPKG